ncbi:RNA-directed DNA polymerase (reverse transcriptase)-related family protein [Rhynchospora pubera]|uniref:RNA-directed DNA polymerase (Reverse transcriptase)-related family protein n=1 Tax=Rhynchospora pubera TaxID=906938 RepID=A0AAV8AIA7_9POAL|nr:RNA-directed DNA polymerase (reverse transcriptase)-related family protein [Rhynchospora pubera]
MKLVANRLRPHLKKVISQEQNAFIKGRCIADNIIMVKEILHSFSQKSFKQHAFLMKADVNKAFDKLDWEFLQLAMRHLNVPDKFIQLLVSSYSRAKITININGRGNDFITPTQGLRQGCPMSPYVFIMAMEVLSRLLQGAMRKNMIRGVKVAHTSPCITHAIYADDLILMGDTAEAEVQVFTSLLHKFALASGLCINPSKSGLWFSKACGRQTMDRVQSAWQARKVQGEERYLGIIIGERGDIKRNGRLLLEKIRTKLSGWKSHMLSHAGRMILIKAVLMSIPVYAMSLEMLPKGILNDINRLMAKFLWGKTDQTRYLTLIGWQKICKPTEYGGLGIKNLEKFGEALFLKMVWSVMADEDKTWVQICKSKYFPVVGFWRAQCANNSSKMWRQILKLRDTFKHQVKWQLGDGSRVNALSQPWYDDWTVQWEATHADRRLKVSSLVDNQTGNWKVAELTRLFTPNQVQSIVMGTNKPDVQAQIGDSLIWKTSKSGRYSVKEGYKELTKQDSVQIIPNVNWDLIWRWKSIAPKVKFFLWRLLHKGLPLATNMHARMSNVSPICQRCHEENEYEMHCMFFCNTSRQVWFASPLGIRVHALPMDIAVTVQQIMGGLDEEGNKIFAYTMWEIWKQRNKTVIEHCAFQPQGVIQMVKATCNTERKGYENVQRRENQGVHEKYDYDGEGWQVILDASWDSSKSAGGAYVLYYKGCVHSIGLHSFEVHDPFHAEAVALKEAMCYVYDTIGLAGDTKVQFFSDCMNLVLAVNQGDISGLPAWRATKTVQEMIVRMEGELTGMNLGYVHRKAVKQPHDLANVARRAKVNYQGGTLMALQQYARVHNTIDENYFQKVQERPP